MAVPLAVDVALNTDVPYIDVEVPFTSHHNVNVLPNGISKQQHKATASYQNVGYILFFARFSINPSSGVKSDLQANGLDAVPNVYVAAGDDMRMGTLLGPPIIQPSDAFAGNIQNGFDNWFINPTPESKLREIKGRERTDDFHRVLTTKIERQSAREEPSAPPAPATYFNFDQGWTVSIPAATFECDSLLNSITHDHMSARSALNYYGQRCWTGEQIVFAYKPSGPPNATTWECSITVHGVAHIASVSGKAQSFSKSEAREQAAIDYFGKLSLTLHETVPSYESLFSSF